MMETISDKNSIRLRHLRKRDKLKLSDRESMSRDIFAHLNSIDEYKNADAYLFYVDYRSEVITTPVIKEMLKQKKTVYCPKVEGLDIVFYRISSFDELKSGYQEILEPEDIALNRFVPGVHDGKTVVIVPGSVFDSEGNRLGYGKGFYDRFFAKHPNLTKIAVGFDLQIYDGTLPGNKNDIKMDMIVTERQVIRING
ncbi:MAG: 5-formyltetrahydrofolate cyclo-ligase [Lachnospiraceae bacterium]|nr:5-formyltetrahydrofolate cyclo-ligase [Lachnospiraceae bacterium]